MPAEIHRKLTTILAADAAGYSRLMQANEPRTLDLLRSSFAVFTRLIERHAGRIADTAGDGLIAEFPSVVEAVQCAVEVQQELAPPPDDGGDPMHFRIGIHLGDVMVDGEDLVGEGVNLAARLQSMAEPGGILISQQVYDQVRHKLSIDFDYIGERRPKNFSEDVSVYQVSHGQPQGFFKASRKPAEKPRPKPTHRASVAALADAREQTLRFAKLAGVIVLGLLMIDLFTGANFWVQWPALALGTVVAMQALPMTGLTGARLQAARVSVLVAALVLINLFSWSGVFWAMWPVGALLFTYVAYRIATGRS